MKTTTSTNSHDIVTQQPSLNDDSVTNFGESILERIDDTEFDLEKIMFEEFAYGLPSDIPMADY